MKRDLSALPMLKNDKGLFRDCIHSCRTYILLQRWVDMSAYSVKSLLKNVVFIIIINLKINQMMLNPPSSEHHISG